MELLPSACDDVVASLRSHQIGFGAEVSFKLGASGALFRDRALLGVPLQGLAISLLDLASAWGMPPDGRQLLDCHAQRASALLFGVEPRPGGEVRKVYLEFWDDVRAAVRRTGTREPQLLHLGVKWRNTGSRWELARYQVLPLLSTRDALRRITEIYGDAAASAPSTSIVRTAWHAAPDAAFLFELVDEEGNPRRSFDINLYPAALHVAAVEKQLLDAALRLGVSSSDIGSLLDRYGRLPLGHLSGGLDRTGQEFLSIYAELAPMPGPSTT
ncbi:hypothetical protein [Ramlibacter algicola]|uniref:Uncharacterized protein n=1 Tax=Ramlibacter algicola TaxID=2795217 RepID=A0A934Q2M0_9BURK|nr:hypothetical protein [Ramlibacter algicola]MBK0395000.1 hypothetical protein [Ramlibacter algicola]